MYRKNGNGKNTADWPAIIQVIALAIVVIGGYFATTIRIETSIARSNAIIQSHAGRMDRMQADINWNKKNIYELVNNKAWSFP